MSFLPIVERELRASARRKSTYRIRWWTALIAIAVSFCWLIFVWLTFGRHNAGKALFAILRGYTFAFFLLAGVFLTADSIAEEKREGTLGLLFLTHLRGYDVVLGKFVARALNPFYALFALLPLLGLPLLVGGVTGSEFWRMTLALVNALFFSLAIGICVSAFARDSQNAVALTVPLLMFITGALPAAMALGWLTGLWSHLAALSPLWPFRHALEPLYLAQPGQFWTSLLASHLFGWIFLALASVALPKLWQDRSVVGGTARGKLSRLLPLPIPWGEGRAEGRAGQRWGRTLKSTRRPRELLDLNPVLWLIGDYVVPHRLAWMIVLVWGAIIFSLSPLRASTPLWNFFPARICGFLLKTLVAAQACAFFVEARRSGSLELLLCTPLRTIQILKGQWLALRRAFLWPLVTFFLLNLVPVFFSFYYAMSRPAGPQLGAVIASLAGGIFTVLWGAIGLSADVLAVGWFGMWLALTSKRPNLAPAMTILFVLVLPSLGTFCGLDMIADLFFILWAATQLHSDLRWLVARHYQPAKTFFPRPVSTPAAWPLPVK
jgi:ABC-type transport system involved in multi-copper enzyme maturation permease subunit